MQRQLIADQRLWRRVPAAMAAILWPLEVLLLGWDAGRWIGAATVVVLAILTVVAPPRLAVSIYLVDLLERLLRLPFTLGWLLLVWHLSAREPIFPILGLPVLGAVVVAASAWLFTRIIAVAFRMLAQRIIAQGSTGGA
jgi:hypothetical protein